MSEEPQTLEDALRQFDAYKKKTLDWQAKVKDRDLKMRAQLQTATDQVRDQQSQLDAAAKEAARLQKRIEELEAAEVATKASLDDVAEAINRAVAAVTSEYESQLAARQTEVSKLRRAVEIAEERCSATAATLLSGNGLISDCTVRRRTAIDGAPANAADSWLLCIPSEAAIAKCSATCGATVADAISGGVGIWLREARLPSDVRSQLELPEVEPKVEDVRRELCAEIEALKTATREAERALTLRLQECEARHETRFAETKAKLEASIRDLQSKVAAVESDAAVAVQTADQKAAQLILAAKFESDRRLAETLAESNKAASAQAAQYEEKIQRLEAYVSKAQAAMKALKSQQDERQQQQHHQGVESSEVKAPVAAVAALQQQQHDSAAAEIQRLQEQLGALSTKHINEVAELRASLERSVAEAAAARQSILELESKLQAAERRQQNGGVDDSGSPAVALARLRLQHQQLTEQVADLQHENATLERALAESKTAVDSLRVELSLAKNAGAGPTGKVKHRDAVQASTPPAQTDASIAPLARKPSGALMPAPPDNAVGGLDFTSLLATVDAASVIAPAAPTTAITDYNRKLEARMREELDQANAELLRVKSELRDLAALHERQAQQKALLAEQLREMDRKMQRQAVFADASSPSSAAAAKPDAPATSATGVEYLKNIVLQFMAHPELRPALLPVLAQLMALSPAESATLKKAL